jgi:hypothetical protein
MVEWWWIPAAFGIVILGAVAIFFLLNLKSFCRYLKISAM